MRIRVKKQIRNEHPKLRLLRRITKVKVMKFNLDLLRSRHVLLGMNLGCVFSPPKPFLNFPSDRALKRIRNRKTGLNSLPVWCGCARFGAGAPTGQVRQIWGGCPNSAAHFFVHNFWLAHPIASPFFFNESYESPLRSPPKKPTQHHTKTYQKHQKLEVRLSI